MKMQPVKSSNIAAVGYDADAKRMHVQFTNGTTYAYDDVDEATHKAVVGAKSVGKAVHTMVKGKFKHSIVGSEQQP